jgi:hypothetical protein
MTDKPDSYSGFNEYNPLLDTDVSQKIKIILSILFCF